MRRLALLLCTTIGCGFAEPADPSQERQTGMSHPEGETISPDDRTPGDDPGPDAQPGPDAPTGTTTSGTFAAAASYATDDDPVALAIGDYNNDGRPDIAVANNKNQGSNIDTLGTVSVLLSNANGTLQAAHTFTVGYGPDGITAGDFNGDGKLDLVTVNLAQGKGGYASILLGNGDGTFGTATNVSACCSPTAVASTDLDGNGKLDLVVTNYNAIQILLGNGNGAFAAPTPYTLTGAYTLALGDMNGDGKLDAISESGYAPNPSVGILLGNGNGTLQTAATATTPKFFDGIAVADLDHDNKLDVLTANPGNTISIHPGTGTSTVSTATEYPMGMATVSVTSADFNGDGNADIAATAADSNAVYIRLGNGTTVPGASTSYATPSGPVAIATADFNADGRRDLAVVNAGADSVSILLGQP